MNMRKRSLKHFLFAALLFAFATSIIGCQASGSVSDHDGPHHDDVKVKAKVDTN